MDDTIRVCRRCYAYLQNKLVDPTMSIFYGWSEQCGSSPPLPNSLKISCSKRVELVSYLDVKLNSDIRETNPNFPVFLLDNTEKESFTECLKRDQTIKNIIEDINSRVLSILRQIGTKTMPRGLKLWYIMNYSKLDKLCYTWRACQIHPKYGDI